MPLSPIFFLPENSFFGYRVKEVQKEKIQVRVRERNVCMYIKDWFKPNFFLFLILLLCKLKFQIPMVNFASPIVISQVMPTHTSTGLFISPSGISDPCGTVAGMVTPKESMSTEGETLQVSVLPYRCSIC